MNVIYLTQFCAKSQDRNIRVYAVSNGKHSRTFRGSSGDDGTLIKVCLDRSGAFAAASCTDKSLAVYDYHSGECMATMVGHSELVTGVRFTNDCRHLVSVSGQFFLLFFAKSRDGKNHSVFLFEHFFLVRGSFASFL